MDISWRKDEEEGSVNSSASVSMGGRRRLIVSTNKRKATDGAIGGNQLIGKRPQLRLRDEEITLSAEAAEQPRRDQ